VPASPAPLVGCTRSGALHLPGEPPAPLPAAERALVALLGNPPPGP
jgi:hypothetical protein